MNDQGFESWFIGVLANDIETRNEIKREAIFNSAYDKTVYFVRRLSSISESSVLNKVNYISAYREDLAKFGFDDELNMPEETAIKKIRAFLSDKIILFKVFERGFESDKATIDKNNFILFKKTSTFDETTIYHAFPVFSPMPKGSIKTFEQFFKGLGDSKKAFGLINGLSHTETPEFLIWADVSKKEVKIISGILEHSYSNYDGYHFTKIDRLSVIDYKDEWYDDYISHKDIDVVFLPESLLEIIRNTIETSNEQHNNSAQPLSSDEVFINREILPAMTIDNNCGANKELDFIEHFIKLIKKQGFLYNKADLVNFHVAVKSSKLVILSGMSGTGKSKLIDLYKNALGLSPLQYLVIPVRPSWNDDSDLLGYIDVVHNIYRPSDTGLIDLLLKAQKEPEKLFIVCFDEMNLSRVEHYFSLFLSVLEKDPDDRVLNIYNENMESRLYNKTEYPPSIKIGENIKFFGTVNIDESTHHFSDKVLDRANIIELRMLPFKDLKPLSGEIVELDDTIAYDDVLCNDYYKCAQNNSAIKLSDHEIDYLEKLHAAFVEARGTGFGYRIVKQINAYLNALPNTPYLDRKEAFDLQIVQRILTKLRGSEDELGDLIGHFNVDSKEVVKSKLLSLFDEYAIVSDFSVSRENIKLRAKELKFNGYTI